MNLMWPWNRIEKKFEVLQQKLDANRRTFTIEEVQALVKKVLEEGRKPTFGERLKNFSYEIIRMSCVGFNWYQELCMKGVKALWHWILKPVASKQTPKVIRRSRPNMMTRL